MKTLVLILALSITSAASEIPQHDKLTEAICAMFFKQGGRTVVTESALVECREQAIAAVFRNSSKTAKSNPVEVFVKNLSDPSQGAAFTLFLIEAKTPSEKDMHKKCEDMVYPKITNKVAAVQCVQDYTAMVNSRVKKEGANCTIEDVLDKNSGSTVAWINCDSGAVKKPAPSTAAH